MHSWILIGIIMIIGSFAISLPVTFSGLLDENGTKIFNGIVYSVGVGLALPFIVKGREAGNRKKSDCQSIQKQGYHDIKYIFSEGKKTERGIEIPVFCTGCKYKRIKIFSTYNSTTEEIK